MASAFHFVGLQHGDKNCEIIEAAAGFVLFLLDILPVNIVAQCCLACLWHFREGDTRPFFLMPFVFNRWYVWNPSSYFPCRRSHGPLTSFGCVFHSAGVTWELCESDYYSQTRIILRWELTRNYADLAIELSDPANAMIVRSAQATALHSSRTGGSQAII